MQSWKPRVDCTTFETRTQSDGPKPNENVIPDKVYCLPITRHTGLTTTISRPAGWALQLLLRLAALAIFPGRAILLRPTV